MHILVVGGAGYIGCHMVKKLLESGQSVTVLDNFSTGHRSSVIGGEIIEGNCGDQTLLDSLFRKRKFDCVMQFASFIQVGESVTDPGKYYRNNTVETLSILESMVRNRVTRFIFSSSAAIFGEPKYVPIDENHPKFPINPYGASKLMVERILEDFDKAHGLRSVSLRYFNAAGADPDGKLGERHDPETHLIPLVLMVASGRRESVGIFGDDYDTPDGTCIRDYIHIIDLCKAHLLAMNYLKDGGQTARFNLGNGEGFSVREVIAAVEASAGKPIRCFSEARRPGDPARLVADSKLARSTLGWNPIYGDLSLIVRHAWAWEQRLAGSIR